MVRRVCLVSSGTGGHLLPALALADRLNQAGHETLLVTEGRSAERELLQRNAAGAEVSTLDAGRGPLQLFGATRRARRYLRDQGVDLVVATGGRTAVPVGWAARSLGIPLVLLEQNAVTGRANRLLMPFADRVYSGLPMRRMPGKAVLTGTPLRAGFGHAERSAARDELDLAQDDPVVLVTGGSQGAQALNRCVPEALGRVAGPLQVLHLSGVDRDQDVRDRYDRVAPSVRAMVRPMAADMVPLYAAADLVICRGGGCTVAELIASGRPAVIVPYPHHRDQQQLHNGRVLSERGAARLSPEPLDPEALGRDLQELLDSPQLLAEMGEAAAAVGAGDSCGLIFSDLEQSGVLA